ncbi:MAG: 4-(cytidine 5'-diphospho)-2-C-methyl-D-erythritol kinase [Bacteroidia bacterium]
MALILFPNVKINLGLLIKGKLPNGYHLLETVFYPVSQLYDRLELRESSEFVLNMAGIDLQGKVEENLCYKAYQLVKEHYPKLPNVQIDLTKNIPAGAGLGGGSSDAASTILGLNELFALKMTQEKMAQMGAKLGADVPFFIYNRPMFAAGIGTDLQAIELELPYRIELITPPIHSSTVAAYKALNYQQFDATRDLQSIISQPISAWKDLLVNDLEIPVFEMYPQLKQIKAELYEKGAIYAAMSGSGSAVFGLF